MVGFVLRIFAAFVLVVAVGVSAVRFEVGRSTGQAAAGLMSNSFDRTWRPIDMPPEPERWEPIEQRTSGLGWTSRTVQVVAREGSARWASTTRDRWGWPLRCFQREEHHYGGRAFRYGSLEWAGASLVGIAPRPVPLFVDVAVFLVPVSAVSGGLAALRRRHRRKRGRCVECAYQVAGLGRCPECGRVETIPPRFEWLLPRRDRRRGAAFAIGLCVAIFAWSVAASWTSGIKIPSRVQRIKLHEVVQLGSLLLLERLIDEGGDVNAVWGFRTPLQIAARWDRMEAAITLIDAGADVTGEIGSTSPPLLFARSTDMVHLLLERGADVNAAGLSRSTPLHAAVGAPEVIEALLAAGADPNAMMDQGITPVHRAAALPALDSLRLLLDGGGDLDRLDGYGRRALHAALPPVRPPRLIKVGQSRADDSAQRVAIVRLLVERGARVDDPNDATSPLHLAAQRGSVDVLRALLDAGADVSRRDGDGNTALHHAIDWLDEPAAIALLEAGALLDQANDVGFTPRSLLSAFGPGRFGDLKALVRAGDE